MDMLEPNKLEEKPDQIIDARYKFLPKRALKANTAGNHLLKLRRQFRRRFSDELVKWQI